MNRNGLMKHVAEWCTRLGSQVKVAEKCKISDTSMSLWRNGKYGADTKEMDKKIAASLGYKEEGWQVVTTIKNYKKIEVVFNSCKRQSMWMAISNKAGSGKTQTLEYLFNNDLSGNVIFIQAEEWNARQFLLELAERTCGIPKKGYADIPTLLKKITIHLNGMASDKPLLVIDEADKLKPAAFRKLIPLYNRTEHRLGCVLAGTENLQKEIEQGVRGKKKGYDEIESRLGRSYIDLPGAPKEDVIAICLANGLSDSIAENIWSEVDKVTKMVKARNPEGKETKVEKLLCEDLRRLMRLVKRAQLSNEFNQL